MESIVFAKRSIPFAGIYSAFCDMPFPCVEAQLEQTAPEVFEASADDVSFFSVFESTVGYFGLRLYLMANNEGHIADFLEEIMDYRKISSRQRRFYMASLLTEKYSQLQMIRHHLGAAGDGSEETSSPASHSMHGSTEPDSRQSPMDCVGVPPAAAESGNSDIMMPDPSEPVLLTGSDDLMHGGATSCPHAGSSSGTVSSPMAARHSCYTQSSTRRSSQSSQGSLRRLTDAAMQSSSTSATRSPFAEDGQQHNSVPYLLLNAFLAARLRFRPIEEVWVSVRMILAQGDAPAELFDELVVFVVRHVMTHVFPGFLQSPFYSTSVALERYCRNPVTISKESFDWLGRVGRGGYGCVYAVRKQDTGKLYAVKVMNKRLIKSRKAFKLILNERDVLASVDHPFLTGLKYSFQTDDEVCFAMDVLMGGDLEYHLARHGRFSEDAVRFYMAELLLALRFMHCNGMMHRDVKPANVLIDAEGHIKLSDMGLSVFVASGAGYVHGTCSLPIGQGVAQSAEFRDELYVYTQAFPRGRRVRPYVRGKAGTPGFWAPEMLLRDPDGRPSRYDGCADWWSFGCMMYALLAGRGPFTIKGGHTDDDNHATMHLEPGFPSHIFSPVAEDLIRRLLVRRPDMRLGAGATGIDSIMAHPFFHNIDWSLLEARQLSPPWKPDATTVRLQHGIHPKDAARMAKVADLEVTPHDQHIFRYLPFANPRAIQEEVIENMTLTRLAPSVPTGEMPMHTGLA